MKKEKTTMSSSNRVLIEHFDAKFGLVLDGYSATNKRIDDLKEKVGNLQLEMNEKFEVVFEILDEIKKEVKGVKI